MVMDEKLFNFLMKYYGNGRKENARFFNRLGNPDIHGKTVLEIGCGTGSLAVDMVEKYGAAHVFSVDLIEDNVEFAKENLRRNHFSVADKIEYHCMHIEDLSSNRLFDCVVSKDSFEHIIEFESVFSAMVSHVSQAGRILAGWGPLYYSPRGGHALTTFPWSHLLFPEDFLIKSYQKRCNGTATSIKDYGLNRFLFKDYVKIMKKFNLEETRFRVNVHECLLQNLLGLTLAKLPVIGNLFIFNAYLIFTKPTEKK